MKKVILLLFFVWIGSQYIPAVGQVRSEKRGLAYSIPYVEDIKALSPGVSWYYNWAITPGNSQVEEANGDGKYLRFIPMAWNNAYNRNQLREYLRTHPGVKYVLGFNEPNFTAQARMTPSEAAAAWPELEAIADEFDLKLVSPAVNYAPGNGAVSENGVTYTDPFKYLEDFFSACPDCRVDYIAVHSYMDWDGAVDWYVGEFIEKFGKPVWLTEFCAWENNQGNLNPEFQRDQLVRKVELLERNDRIAGYAWFIGRSGNDGSYPYMQLLKKNQPGVLTELGKVYTYMSSFDKDHYFAVGQTIPAKDYIRSAAVSLGESSDSESGQILQLTGLRGEAYADYQVEVPAAGTYSLTLRIASEGNLQLRIASDGEPVANETVAGTGGIDRWNTRFVEIELPAGKQTLRIGNGGDECLLGWLHVAEKGSGTNSQSVRQTEVFTDPVREILYVRSKEFIDICRVFNMQGKQMVSVRNSGQVNLSGLAAGVYFAEICFRDGGREIRKFVKSR